MRVVRVQVGRAGEIVIDGRAVPTPVWFARVGNHWYVFSAGSAGKVKRLRHTEAVTVAACDMVVSGDTLGMHMAIARGKFVVAWFGLSCAQEIDLFEAAALAALVGSNYAFKAICALIDTVPLYAAVHWLRGYLQLAPGEYAIDQPT